MLVTNNTFVCFPTAVSWTRRNGSRIEYRLSQVWQFLSCFLLMIIQCPSLTCLMHEVSGLCTSACSTCGVLCEAFPITDLATADVYQRLGCTTIIGDLYLSNIPTSATRLQLAQRLVKIAQVKGDVVIKDSFFATIVTYLDGLKSVYSIRLLNLPLVTDARFTALLSIRDGVEVIGCDRLCPERYPRVGQYPSDLACPNNTIEFYWYITGTVTPSDLFLVSSIVNRIIFNVTNRQVHSFLSISAHLFSGKGRVGHRSSSKAMVGLTFALRPALCRVTCFLEPPLVLLSRRDAFRCMLSPMLKKRLPTRPRWLSYQHRDLSSQSLGSTAETICEVCFCV